MEFLWCHINPGPCPSFHPYPPAPATHAELQENHREAPKHATGFSFRFLEGLGPGKWASRFQGVQRWHPRRSLPAGQMKGHLSPQWTLILRAVPFEWAPGADADLRNKWAHPKLQMWGLATELTTQIASLIDEPGQLVCSTGWEHHALETGLRVIFWCVTIHPFVVLEHSGAGEANHPSWCDICLRWLQAQAQNLPSSSWRQPHDHSWSIPCHFPFSSSRIKKRGKTHSSGWQCKQTLRKKCTVLKVEYKINTHPCSEKTDVLVD